MKHIISTLFLFLFLGCSQTSLQTAWTRTKDASYSAVTDPVTWAPMAVGITLYATNTDQRISKDIMNHPPFYLANDDMYREINGAETYLTALMIDDNDSVTKLKRVAVEATGFAVARTVTDTLSYSIEKENPSHTRDDAIGSHHAIDTFTGSAMNRRNVDQLDIPEWGKYTLNGISYFTASASAFARVQEGGHSLGDQFIHASIGNFLGLFIHDLFMKEDTHIELSVANDAAYMYTNWKF